MKTGDMRMTYQFRMFRAMGYLVRPGSWLSEGYWFPMFGYFSCFSFHYFLHPTFLAFDNGVLVWCLGDLDYPIFCRCAAYTVSLVNRFSWIL